MTSEELREQVGRVSAGDTVTARFDSPWDGKYTRFGKVWENDGWLFLRGEALRTNAGPAAYLVAIESHEPAKPPVPPEPLGDALVLVFGTVYRRQGNGEWWPLNTTGAGYKWPDLVDEWRRSREPTPVVYRAEPSPERIEELAALYAESDAACKPFDHLREFAAALLGGEQ